MIRQRFGPPPDSPRASGVCSKCGGTHEIVFGRTGNVVRAQSCKSPRRAKVKGKVSTGAAQNADAAERRT